MKKNFHFLKTTLGRGYFDLFCAGLFLVTGNSVTDWIMFAVLVVCGVFFVVMGCLNREVGGEDIDYREVQKQALQAGFENRSLLQ